MRILHVVPGLDEVGNGISVAAKFIANEQGADLVEARLFASGKCDASQYDEVWVHSAWSPMVLRSCRRVLKSGKRLVRMAHANYDPVRLDFHGWKKRIVSPVDRYYLRQAVKVVATCEAEKGWIESYLGRRCPPIELTDIKRFFKLESGKVSRVEHVERVEGDGEVLTRNRPLRVDATPGEAAKPSEASAESRRVAECAEYDTGLPSADGGLGQRPRDNSASSRLCVNNKNQDEPLHLLYLGRRHPLKGVEYLETAVRQIEKNSAYSASSRLCVKYISSAFGDELEKVWDWCDILILPTLSENFGLVIAEALERGKRVITTDGAPAWGEGNTYGGRLVYLKGYRDGSPEKRVELLRDAIKTLMPSVVKPEELAKQV